MHPERRPAATFIAVSLVVLLGTLAATATAEEEVSPAPQARAALRPPVAEKIKVIVD